MQNLKVNWHYLNVNIVNNKLFLLFFFLYFFFLREKEENYSKSTWLIFMEKHEPRVVRQKVQQLLFQNHEYFLFCFLYEAGSKL